MILLGLLGGGFALWKIRTTEAGGREIQQARGTARGPVPVVAGQAERRDFPIYLNALGTVQPYNSVTVRARVDGELQQIYFQEGRMCRREICWRRSTLAPTRLNSIRPRPRRRRMRPSLRMPRLSSQRNAQLIKNSVIDQQTYDTQKYTVDQLQALVAADQAAIDNAQTQLDYTHITAPISGRVGIRLVDAGNIVRSTETAGMLTINQVQPISVVVHAAAAGVEGSSRCHSSRKRRSRSSPWIATTSPSSAKDTLEVLDNQIDSTTATLKLKAVFANTNYDLWPGQFVNVRLLLGTKMGP